MEAEVGWRMACLVWASAHIPIGLPLNRFLVPLGTQPVPSATNQAAPAASGEPTGLQYHAMVLLA